MNIKMIPTGKIEPYIHNNKKHTKEQIEQIAKSISQFGFRQPIVVDDSGIIIVGHGRYEAAKLLGYKKVPCVVIDDLSEDEIRAYRIIDNKTNESDWDFDSLEKELGDLEMFDMAAFGFDSPWEMEREKEEQERFNKDATQFRVANILNLEKGDFGGEGYYGIPLLDPVYELPPIRKWIGFNEVLSDKDPDGKAVHFFIDDYQFERVWENPEKYLDKLRRYVCITTPDFSPYGDMPRALQIFNHYRKHWVGRWFQENGLKVIPTIRCSSDMESLNWYLDGEPKGGIVIMSSMWTSREGLEEISKAEYMNMKETLEPCKIFIYGKDYGTMGIEEDDPVEFIDTFTWRFDNGEGK